MSSEIQPRNGIREGVIRIVAHFLENQGKETLERSFRTNPASLELRPRRQGRTRELAESDNPDNQET